MNTYLYRVIENRQCKGALYLRGGTAGRGEEQLLDLCLCRGRCITRREQSQRIAQSILVEHVGASGPSLFTIRHG